MKIIGHNTLNFATAAVPHSHEILSPFVVGFDTVDDDEAGAEDPDAVADPIYQVDLQVQAGYCRNWGLIH